MALREHRCTRCGETQYAFEGEEHRIVQGNCGKFMRWCHNFRVMPPNPIVIHTTDTWMSEPQLDSFQTVYELDRQLNIEAANERETKLMLEARKNG